MNNPVLACSAPKEASHMAWMTSASGASAFSHATGRGFSEHGCGVRACVRQVEECGAPGFGRRVGGGFEARRARARPAAAFEPRHALSADGGAGTRQRTQGRALCRRRSPRPWDDRRRIGGLDAAHGTRHEPGKGAGSATAQCAQPVPPPARVADGATVGFEGVRPRKRQPGTRQRRSAGSVSASWARRAFSASSRHSVTPWPRHRSGRSGGHG